MQIKDLKALFLDGWLRTASAYRPRASHSPSASNGDGLGQPLEKVAVSDRFHATGIFTYSAPRRNLWDSFYITNQFSIFIPEFHCWCGSAAAGAGPVGGLGNSALPSSPNTSRRGFMAVFVVPWLTPGLGVPPEPPINAMY